MHAPLAGMHQEVFRKNKTALKASGRPKLFGETLGFGRLTSAHRATCGCSRHRGVSSPGCRTRL